jgi:predicted metalloprotease
LTCCICQQTSKACGWTSSRSSPNYSEADGVQYITVSRGMFVASAPTLHG